MNLNGNRKKIEPFPPGTFEEYDLTDSGFAKFVRRQRYFSPGDRPTFKPFVSFEGSDTCIIFLIVSISSYGYEYLGQDFYFTYL